MGTSHTDGAHGGTAGLDEQLSAPEAEEGTQSPEIVQYMSKGISESRLDGHPPENAYRGEAVSLFLL